MSIKDDLFKRLWTFEYNILEQALREHPTKAQAARSLGINRTTFIEKLRKFGFPLNPPSREEVLTFKHNKETDRYE